MNRYELAVHEVEMVFAERSSIHDGAAAHRLADAVVERLVEQGIIQSTTPGDLVPGGITEQYGTVHKATPMNGSGSVSQATCRHCGLQIRTVIGGRGATWVHALTGAVAGSGGPRA